MSHLKRCYRQTIPLDLSQLLFHMKSVWQCILLVVFEGLLDIWSERSDYLYANLPDKNITLYAWARQNLGGGAGRSDASHIKTFFMHKWWGKREPFIAERDDAYWPVENVDLLLNLPMEYKLTVEKEETSTSRIYISCSSGVLLARHFPLDIKRASPVGEENNSRESQLGEELLRELCNANKVNQGMHVTELVLKSGEKLPLIFYVIGLSFLRHVMQVPYCVNDKLCM